MPKTNFDICQHITDKLIEAIEAGVMPWQKPWAAATATALPVNSKGRPYNGVNVLMLWAAAALAGYTSNRWFTFKQAKAAGGCVRKGERSTRVILWRPITRTETDDAGEESERTFLVARSYCVFNADQVEGLEADAGAPLPAMAADDFILDVGADIRHGGTRAFYSLAGDYVRLPSRASFDGADAYRATALHELVHWTGAGHRLDRQFGERFGDDAYAFEELVAEIGAAFLGARLGVQGRSAAHASYVDNWLKVLQADKRAIISAASAARKAMEYLTDCAEAEASIAA